jgi:hypothetical protein
MHYKFEGAAAGLPLLEHFGYNDFREADPLGWHSHEGFEFVFLTEGAATYEIEPSGPVFPVRRTVYIDSSRSAAPCGERYERALPHVLDGL